MRLTPPWQPVRVLREAASLRDGRAVLGLPRRLRWVAEHQPDGRGRYLRMLTGGHRAPPGRG
jgi:ligand-binding SRPBCC domain-containing protein